MFTFSFVNYPQESKVSNFYFSFFRVPRSLHYGYRIIEIEWAVKHNKEFVPSPKPFRRAKKKKSKPVSKVADEATMDVDDENELKPTSRRTRAQAAFGLELTNAGLGLDSPSKSKRPLDSLGGEDDVETPPKKQRRDNGKGVEDSEIEEWVLPTPPNQMVS